MTQDIREQTARIIDPHSFLEYSGDDEMVGEIVRQSREDALRKADRIKALFNNPSEPLRCLRCGTVDAFGFASVERE